jgi:hypothetical protein
LPETPNLPIQTEKEKKKEEMPSRNGKEPPLEKKKKKKRPNHPHKIIEADTIRLASVQGQDPEI